MSPSTEPKGVAALAPPQPFSRLRGLVAGPHLIRYLAECQARQGDPFVVPLFGLGRIVITGHPEGVRDVFAMPNTVCEPQGPNPLEPILGSGSIFLMKGDRHRRERRLMTPLFLAERMRAYGPQIQALTLAEMRRWKVGEPVEAQAFTHALALQVILRVIFGVRSPERRAALHGAISDLLHSYTVPLALVPPLRRDLLGLTGWKRFTRARERVRALLLEEIAGRRREGGAGREDILSLLVEARYPDGGGLSDEALHDALCTLLVAGHETVALGLAWAFHFALNDDSVGDALRAELEPLGADATPEALSALPYVGALAQEALRRHPNVPVVARQLSESASVRGVELPKGTSVSVGVALLHMNPDVYPDPERFRPQRFLDRSYAPHEFAPFGGGVRRCLGAAFGLYEMKVVLGTAFSRARLAPVPGPAPRAVLKGISYAPDRPIRMVLREPLRGEAAAPDVDA
ncbi:MAG TPA: cytochrome P450 [Polyangiaceae bacterium]|nr:cytochrome P450 [Polyangiaceae bacterium]